MSDQATLQQTFDAAMAELPPKHRKLVIEYLRDLHQHNAAIRAKYTPEHANTILRNLKVLRAIDAGLALQAMEASEVLARLTQQARGSIAPFLRRDADGDMFGFDLSETQPLHLIKKASVTRRKLTDHATDALVTVETLTIELYDAQAALALLGKHHGLFTEKIEHTGAGGGPIQTEIYDYSTAIASIAARSGEDSDAPGEDASPGDGPTLGQEHDGRGD